MRRSLRPSPLVDAWFDLLPAPQQPLLRRLHGLVLDAEPALVPAVKWGSLGYADAGRPVLLLVPQRHQAQLQVVHGAALAHRFPELGGEGRTTRMLRLRYTHPIDDDLVRDLVHAAVQASAQAQAARRDGGR
jgi:hypothetical protein